MAGLANHVCGECLDGFGEDGGGMCFMPQVTYAAEVGGTLSADVASGQRVDFGTTITIAAVASVGFNLLEWQGDGGHCAEDLECVVTVVSDVSVGASFLRDCGGENRLGAMRIMSAGVPCGLRGGRGRDVLYAAGDIRGGYGGTLSADVASGQRG